MSSTRKSKSAPRRASIETITAHVGATVTAVGVGCGGWLVRPLPVGKRANRVETVLGYA